MSKALWFSLGLILSAGALSRADDGLRSIAESSGFRATARYEEEMALCRRLAGSSRLVHLSELGKTGEDRSIPLLIVADSPVKTAQEALRSGKLVVLLIGNIHAGEVDGKEALPMLIRDLVARPDHPLLKDLILAVVPIYNADGNERVAKDNRPGQVGPEEGMGQRENAKGLDLNRDFMKLDAPETRALVQFLNEWDPHLVIDTHTTNGSHHRYTITYEGPKNPAGDARIIRYCRDTMLPAIGTAYEKSTGHHAYFYGNFNRDHTRWTSYPAQPRYGTTYIGLRNRLAILSEAYAYASYETRVKDTQAFVQACLDHTRAHKDEIRKLLSEAREATVNAGQSLSPDDRVPIRSEARAFARPVTVLGFVEEEKNGRRVATDEKKDYDVELFQNFVPTAQVRRPFAYLVPARFGNVIETLQRHGLELLELREDIELDLEVYRVDKLDRSRREYEGHRPVNVEVTARNESRRIPAGTFLVRTSQPLGSLAVYLLEPGSDDGLCTWNFFDADLSEGTDFPVTRLLVQTPLLTVPARSLVQARTKLKPITYETLYGGNPPSFNGAPTTASWYDDGAHLLQNREGRPYIVEAQTGRAKPFYDPEPVIKALTTIPTLDHRTAQSMAGGGGGGGGGRLGRRGLGRFGGGGGGLNLDSARKGALFDHENDLYYATLDGSTAARLTSTPGQEELASFSPDGHFVSFVRDNDLWVVDIATQKERALTTGGTDKIRNGKAVWVYYEEVYNRNWKAYWWAPDSKHIAFLQLDDTPVGAHVVINDSRDVRNVEQTPYPRAGDANPTVRLGIVSVAGGPVRWADLSEYTPSALLITEVGFWPDGQSAFCYAQDRAQTWLDFLRISVNDPAPRKLFRETTRAWVDNPGPPEFLPDGSFLLPSERTGWRHLYHYKPDGTLVRQVTSGEWEVRTVHLFDKATGYLYFSGTRDSAIGSHLYRIKLDGSGLERITSAPGVHQVRVSPDGKSFLDSMTDLSTPTHVGLFSTDGRLVRTLDTNPVRALDEYRFGPRELVQIKTSDGFVLEGEVILPPDLDTSKRYPVWFTTYGGPHAPTVADNWERGRTWEQMLATEGFIVFRVDPRPASGKGAVFTWTAYRKLGIQELKDIEEAIAWLKQRPYVDGSRIGMSGHSYGGFMTAFALTHSKTFAAGIAGAPVTDWHDYDTIYTERYMNTPQNNPEGYRETSVVRAAGQLHGKLLILHGGIDDNVSVRNTMHLVQALQQANQDFELMIYPASRHGIFGAHYSRLQYEFIKRTLGGPRDSSSQASNRP